MRLMRNAQERTYTHRKKNDSKQHHLKDAQEITLWYREEVAKKQEKYREKYAQKKTALAQRKHIQRGRYT